MKYCVAENTFTIAADSASRAWREVASHYLPFAVSEAAEAPSCVSQAVTRGGDENAAEAPSCVAQAVTRGGDEKAAEAPLFNVRVRLGRVEVSDATLYFENFPDTDGELKIRIFTTVDGFIFEFIQPRTDIANGWLRIDREFRSAEVTVDESLGGVEFWKHCASLTSGIMLAYLLATTPRSTLMAHASCIVNDGRAYLFIAKSGTGKSTHSRLWLSAIPGSMLLNDDHPIVRVYPDGRAVAYGSPWSGKTNCYVNASAEIGAIVRIRRGKSNAISRLRPSLAYASCLTSFSYMPGVDHLAEARHNAIEQLVLAVPNYELHCLPDADAARLCYETVKPAADGIR